MSYPELITDKEAFSCLRRQCENTVNLQRRLPTFVFKHPFAKYYAIEHREIHKKAFGALLFRLSNIFGDKSVNYMTIEPDPVNYYYRYLSFFGLASFEPSSLIDRYKPVMSRGGAVDSFLARGGDVGVFWGSSSNWGIFCDRISWEIAIVAISGDVDISGDNEIRYMEAQMIASHLRNQYPQNTSSSEIAEQLFVNYAFE